jgi:hypothetical protein
MVAWCSLLASGGRGLSGRSSPKRCGGSELEVAFRGFFVDCGGVLLSIEKGRGGIAGQDDLDYSTV